jgi:DNA-binding response OmpR family regulator
MRQPPLIFLAEDNPADVFLVRTALGQEGLDYELQVLSDGEQVIRFFEDVEREAAPCPDLLILDLNLPKRSGLEILEGIRKSSISRDVRVVIMTSSDSGEDRQRVGRIGISHYFLKRADLDEFMKLGPVVRAVLESQPLAV